MAGRPVTKENEKCSNATSKSSLVDETLSAKEGILIEEGAGFMNWLI